MTDEGDRVTFRALVWIAVVFALAVLVGGVLVFL